MPPERELDWWADHLPKSDNSLERLGQLRAVRITVEGMIEQAVAECREEGFSWAQIADVLGTSRQSAWERFSG